MLKQTPSQWNQVKLTEVNKSDSAMNYIHGTIKY